MTVTHVNQYSNVSEASCQDSRGYVRAGFLLQCSMCDYCTKKLSLMKNHIRTHIKEKPYKCNVCNYESAQKSTLAIHMRIHGGEKPFKCDICDFASTWKHGLVEHLRTHSEEKHLNVIYATMQQLRNNI